MSLSFDIGANRGGKLSHLKDKFDKVVAFEPNPELMSFLKSNFENYNIVFDDRAISNKEEKKEFNLCHQDVLSTFSEDWITNSRFTGSYSWDRKIIVDTITLDYAIDFYGKPDYIKIDVEGYEYEVMQGFSKLLENCVISFEWAEEQKEKIKLILDHLIGLGYNKFSYTELDDVKFDDEIDWVDYDSFQFLDVLIPERKSLWGMVYFKLD